MNSASRIFWFSGTGNSLFAAKTLACGLGDIPLHRMADGVLKQPVGGSGVKIGFVFPSYFCDLPRLVRAFVTEQEILPDTEIFTVITMGGGGQGSVHALDKLLREKGLRLSYGGVLTMPANYVLKYNPADAASCDDKLEKCRLRLQEYASEIMAGKRRMSKLPFGAKNLYRNIEQLDAAFCSTDACTGCGLCAKICPVQNIRISDGKPEWLHHCEHCVACISWCPARAIEYGSVTQSRRRYRNPRVRVEEMGGE